MPRPVLGPAGSEVSQRRLEDALDTLNKRREPRSHSVSLPFNGGTSASFFVAAPWITSSHAVVASMTSAAQLAAKLLTYVSVEQGKGFTVFGVSNSALSGEQTLQVISV